jgi:hypothetical protein
VRGEAQEGSRRSGSQRWKCLATELLSQLTKWFGAPSTVRAAWPERVGRCDGMRDIVATIQAEQDEIIRLDHPEVLVSRAAQGTGKTVVTLHRIIPLGVLSVVCWLWW